MPNKKEQEQQKKKTKQFLRDNDPSTLGILCGDTTICCGALNIGCGGGHLKPPAKLPRPSRDLEKNKE